VKYKDGSMGISIFILFLFTSCVNQSEFPVLKGPYLGQKSPGDVPELFAPGIVADIYEEHSAAIFTPDGKEVFWARRVTTVKETGQISGLVVTMHMQQENGVWTKPKLASFNLDSWTFVDDITPDGKYLFLSSSRPNEKGGPSQRPKDWVVNKTNEGWGEPYLFDLQIESNKKYNLRKKTNNGNIYISGKLPKANVEISGYAFGLFRLKLVDGEYQEPVALDTTINSQFLDYAYYIDPDEEYIIFASQRPGGFSEIDLYISYHQPDDSWSEAINLGEKINGAGVDCTSWPYVSPEGKYLFFVTNIKPYCCIDTKQYSLKELQKSQISTTIGTRKIHWVSTSFIEELKPEGLKKGLQP